MIEEEIIEKKRENSMGVGPIQFAVFQIARKIDSVYKDKEFSAKVFGLASDISKVEISPEDWKTNTTLKSIEEFSLKITEEIEM